MADSTVTEAPALDVRDLTVRYDGPPAIEGVTVSIAPARRVGIIGPNGAGKSTFMQAILDLVPRAAGEVRFFGEPFAKARRLVAYVPQRAAVDWDFPASALDVVAMGLYPAIGWFRPVRRRHREEARAHLATVGLADLANRPIGQLSGGERQRVFLARALAQKARLLLLDEPFAGVDARTERIMGEVFRDAAASGVAVACVHHDLGTVPDLFDDVVLLNRRLVAAGPVASVFTPAQLATTYGVPVA